MTEYRYHVIIEPGKPNVIIKKERITEVVE